MEKQKQVLIIEDDRFLSVLMKARLEKDGYAVQQAFDGLEGIQKIKEAKPDLIVLDLIMPKVMGFEVLENVSLDPQLSQIPIVILSNLAQDSDIEKAKRLGALAYFVKIRVSVDDMVNKIGEILKK